MKPPNIATAAAGASGNTRYADEPVHHLTFPRWIDYPNAVQLNTKNIKSRLHICAKIFLRCNLQGPLSRQQERQSRMSDECQEASDGEFHQNEQLH